MLHGRLCAGAGALSYTRGEAHPVNLAQLLVRAARVHPDRPALLHGDRLVWRYRELAARVARLAGHLRALGLAPGDRVALLMKNHVSYLEALYAAWWAGLAAVPINAKLHPSEVDYIVATRRRRRSSSATTSPRASRR